MENNLLNNLMPFYVGQKVVNIGSKALPKGEIKIVKQIVKLSCGCFAICIGFPKQNNSYAARCKDHLSELIPITHFSWFKSYHFAPIQESPFPSLTMKEVIEKEKVLTCLN